jgi:hypothetical protein
MEKEIRVKRGAAYVMLSAKDKEGFNLLLK